MRIIITEEQKKKLFIPRDIDSRYEQWNKEQPILTIDGVHKQINQYDSEGRKQGYWEIYEFDELYSKGSFIDDKEEGYWEFYEGGEIWRKGSYINGKMNGIWEFYDDGDGHVLTRKGSYINGLMDGVWEWYDDDGVTKKLFKNGKQLNYSSISEGYQIKEGRVKESDRVKIYEDDKILVVVPLTHKASCKYGAHTPWCVSVPSTDEHFNEYSDNGILFYFIIKSPYEYGDIKEYKFAYYQSINKDMGEYNGWYDMSDYRYGGEENKETSEVPDIKLIKFLIPKKVMELVFNFIKEQTPVYQKKMLEKKKQLFDTIINDPNNKKIVDDEDWIIMYRDEPFGDDYHRLDWFPDPNKENGLYIIFASKKNYKLYRLELQFYVDIRTYIKSKKAFDSIQIYGLNDYEKEPSINLIFKQYLKKISIPFFANRKKYYKPREHDYMYLHPYYVEIGDIIGGHTDNQKIIKIEPLTGSYKPYTIDTQYPNGKIHKNIYYNEDLGVGLKYDKERHNPTKI